MPAAAASAVFKQWVAPAARGNLIFKRNLAPPDAVSSPESLFRSGTLPSWMCHWRTMPKGGPLLTPLVSDFSESVFGPHAAISGS